MASSAAQQKLAIALGELRALQQQDKKVFRSGELSRTARELLRRNGFLEQIIPGWLMATSPDTRPGDTTPWFSVFWEFCGLYATHRFGKEWNLSLELSIALQTENLTIPNTVIIQSPKGANNLRKLPHDITIFDLKVKAELPDEAILTDHGLRLVRIPWALCRLPESWFRSFPNEAQAALLTLRDSSEVLGPLLEGGHATAASRIAGGLSALGKQEMADEITETMMSAGYYIQQINPFAESSSPHPPLSALGSTPLSARLRAIWSEHREIILDTFPPAGTATFSEDDITRIEEAYQQDAYHSLSIEGYVVSEELIRRVGSGDWTPDANQQDKDDRNALAARGYWLAFQAVKETLGKILDGATPGQQTRTDHRVWYRQLFQPCVAVGLMEPQTLAGYRNAPVFIRSSRHVPPRKEAVPDAMTTLFELLEQEQHPAVRAILGHWMFGYIHPYLDGNGRMARFLMNVMLVSGGYPWTIIPVTRREEYMEALEQASVDGSIEPFAAFVGSLLK